MRALCPLPGAGWVRQRCGALPSVDAARSQVQKPAQLRNFLFVSLFCFILTKPGCIGVGIGAADRDSLNIDAFDSA